MTALSFGGPGDRAFAFPAGTCREEPPVSRLEPIVRSWSAISRSLPQFAPARCPHARRRPMLECLEDRAMLSTIPVATNLTVSSLDDSGVGTLRAAINQADTGTGN